MESKVYLASGYMLNCIFQTNHCPEESLYLVTKDGILEYEKA